MNILNVFPICIKGRPHVFTTGGGTCTWIPAAAPALFTSDSINTFFYSKAFISPLCVMFSGCSSPVNSKHFKTLIRIWWSLVKNQDRCDVFDLFLGITQFMRLFPSASSPTSSMFPSGLTDHPWGVNFSSVEGQKGEAVSFNIRHPWHDLTPALGLPLYRGYSAACACV